MLFLQMLIVGIHNTRRELFPFGFNSILKIKSFLLIPFLFAFTTLLSQSVNSKSNSNTLPQENRESALACVPPTSLNYTTNSSFYCKALRFPCNIFS